LPATVWLASSSLESVRKSSSPSPFPSLSLPLLCDATAALPGALALGFASLRGSAAGFAAGFLVQSLFQCEPPQCRHGDHFAGS
jgi:hypothetical protein